MSSTTIIIYFVIIITFYKLLIFYLKYSIIYNFYNNIDNLLMIDYHNYERCVYNSNLITCARRISKFQKNNKPDMKYRTSYILSECRCNVFKENFFYDNKKSTLILIGVASSPEYFTERYVYRLIYKKYKYLRVLFFMGLSSNVSINMMLIKENKIFNDMILFSFTSSYYKLTTQLICEITWVSRNCMNYKWYIHHTSDTYLNIKFIYLFLLNYTKRKCLIGYIIKHSTVRRKNIIFDIPINVLNFSRYPDYPTGAGYILHKSAVLEISAIIKETHPKVWIDDAFLGIAVSHTNVTLIDLKSLFNMYGSLTFKGIFKYLLVHGLSASEIYFLSKVNS